MTTTPARTIYALLGVEPDATPAQIKKAYRKLARQHHPDTNPGDPQAAARFRQITEAYETLSDAKRRRRYDRATRPASPAAGLATPGQDEPGRQPPGPGPGRHLARIRARHREIPPVVIIIASGTESKQPRWGHYASGRWNVGNDQHAEVMISGEGLRRTPAEVLGTSAARGRPRPGRRSAASRTPPGRAATTTSTSRPAPSSSAWPSSTTTGHGWSVSHRPRRHRDRLRPPARRPRRRHDPVAAATKPPPDPPPGATPT